MLTGTIGQRMTSQRRLLLKLIRDAGGHLDADDLFLKAKKYDSRISLSTIYRNLSLLKELGMVVERRLGEDHHHYEINIAPEHHHLICRNCGEIFEFESPLVEQIKKDVESASHFSITHIEIDIKGYCPECNKKKEQLKVS